MSADGAIVVLCAVPQDFESSKLAARLVNEGLAACVQIGSPVTSVYRWKGGLEASQERLLILKTRRGLFDRVESALKSAHPYDVPEIVAVDIVAGHAPYLAWIEASVRTD